jgi:hypothetical protein
LAKVKEGAENVHTRLQAKAESVGFKNVGGDGTKGEYSQIITRIVLISVVMQLSALSWRAVGLTINAAGAQHG